MCTDSLKTVSLVRLHCNSRPVNYTFNSLTKYKEAIIRKTVAHAIAICLSKQYFRIISRNDYNQMPALRGMIQRFCTPTSCFSFRARVQGWTISFVFNSVKKRKKKKRKTLTAQVEAPSQGNSTNKINMTLNSSTWLTTKIGSSIVWLLYLEVNVSHPGGKKFDSFVLTGVSTHFTVSFSSTYNGLFTDWNT